MYNFEVVDEKSDHYIYEASDMRTALSVHHYMRGTDAVDVQRVPLWA